MQLLHAVGQHLKTSGISATRFGREAVGDPQLVHDLRRGRECRPATTARVLAHIERKRLRIDDAHDALERALLARGGNGQVVARACSAWWSVTFWGARHALTIEADEGAIARIVDRLAEHEFDLPGHIVVDITVVECIPGRIMIEALTIEDR